MKLRYWTGVVAAAFAVSAALGGEHRAVEFARPGGEPLLLDAVVPPGDGPFPAAILVHGGGWEGGDRNKYINYLFEPLTKAGIAWFSVDYRLAPKHRFPAQAEDVEAAIAWVKSNAAKFNIDPHRLTLIGESAGGHIAAYVAARSDHGFAGVVALYGVHDFVSRTMSLGSVGKNVQQLLDVPVLNVRTAARLSAASPISWVHEGMPPFLMIHGTEDKAVPFSQSVEMCAKLRRFANSCELYPVTGGVHGMDHWEPDPSLHHYKKKLTGWVIDASNRHKQAMEAAPFQFPWTLRDVEYSKAGGESLKFDASIPDGAGPHPAVVLVHGGAMLRGTKRSYITPMFEPLAKAGFAWFSIDYRLAPKHKFPAPVDDVMAAVRYLRENARKLRIDPDRISLAGESAGGYLVSYAAARYSAELRVRSVLDFYSVADYVTHTVTKRQAGDTLQLFLDVDAIASDSMPKLREASPVAWVHSKMPPFLMLHGTEDEQVPFDQSNQMCNQMKSAGAVCEVFAIEGGRHGMGSWDRIGKSEYKQRAVDWLKEHSAARDAQKQNRRSAR